MKTRRCFYGCEFSPSLAVAVQRITEPCKEVHECVLEFDRTPSKATRAVLRDCGFERVSKRFVDDLLQ